MNNEKVDVGVGERIAGYVLFGPFILARPCGPVHNCISARTTVGALLGAVVWIAVAFGLYQVLA